MAKPVLRFKINKQSSEVGGRYYGIIEDTPVTPENSILQICEFKKITAFSPEQVLRLVEDVCDGAAQLVARDGQSRQLSSLLKFSPRSRGTFASEDSRWTNQRLIVGARLLKDIKLEMDPSKFVMSNVADVGALTTAAWDATYAPTLPLDLTEEFGLTDQWVVRVNGTRLQTWDDTNTFASLRLTARSRGEVLTYDVDTTAVALTISGFADNGFTVTVANIGSAITISNMFKLPSTPVEILSLDLVVYHPADDIEFKALPLDIE